VTAPGALRALDLVQGEYNSIFMLTLASNSSVPGTPTTLTTTAGSLYPYSQVGDSAYSLFADFGESHPPPPVWPSSLTYTEEPEEEEQEEVAVPRFRPRRRPDAVWWNNNLDDPAGTVPSVDTPRSRFSWDSDQLEAATPKARTPPAVRRVRGWVKKLLKKLVPRKSSRD
ncbi:hypothetical protein FRB90_009976, partial [Tulasnella sp. 427]